MATQNLQIFCDFDGTITVGDTVDYLLETLASKEWKDIEDQWERGEIGSRECMSRQIPLIQGGWAAIEHALASVRVDKSFATFVAWCRQRKIPLTIVSDGLDKVIKHILKREGIKVDNIVSNHLVAWDGTLALEFPVRSHRFVCASGHCKCQILDQAPHGTKIVIGDGRSDFCWSHNADMLFAKDKLLKYSNEKNLDALSYESFLDVRLQLEDMMEATLPAAKEPRTLIPAWTTSVAI